MKVAISPCPNDIYLFHAWITGKVAPPPEVAFADIEALNQLALGDSSFDLIKLSLYTMSRVTERYQLLPVGMAFGKGTGPKLVAKTPFPIETLTTKRLALPGKRTTAAALAERLLPPPHTTLFCLYHEIAAKVTSGAVDCGLLIHETGRTIKEHGLVEIIDLGALWQEQYQLPLPLGGLAIRRDVPDKDALIASLSASLTYAHAHPSESVPLILEKSQEKSLAVIRDHLYAYVNEETRWISPEGVRALALLGGKELSDSLYLPIQTKQKLL